MKKKIMCKKEKEKTGSECICVWRWFYPLWLNSNQLAAKTDADLTGAFLPDLSLTSLFTQVRKKSVPNAVIIMKLVGYPSFFWGYNHLFFFLNLHLALHCCVFISYSTLCFLSVFHFPHCSKSKHNTAPTQLTESYCTGAWGEQSWDTGDGDGATLRIEQSINTVGWWSRSKGLSERTENKNTNTGRL